MYKLIATLLAATVLTWAQAKGNEPPPAQPGDTLKVITLTNALPTTVARQLNAVLGGLAAVSGNDPQKALIVRGSPEAVKVIEEAVAKLDVVPPPAPPQPPQRVTPRVEMTIHLLRGLAQQTTDDIPADLTATVSKLRGLFQYKSYQLLDTIFMQGQALNPISSQGMVPGYPWQYELAYRPDTVNDSAGTLRLNSLRLDIAFPGGNKSTIATNLLVEVGQKTVIGKSNVAGSSDGIILVMQPKIVEQQLTR